MIRRALVGPGPDSDARVQAYAAALGQARATLLDGAGLADPSSLNLGPDAIIDVGDPSQLPGEFHDEIARREAWLVSAAPPAAERPDVRTILATPDLFGGPLAAMLPELGGLGSRTMAKAVVVTDDGYLAPALFRACLALTVLGGPLRRLAARRGPLGSGGETIQATGRFQDGAIAYLEAGAAYPAGGGRNIYQALGRDRLLEYDSRSAAGRVLLAGQPLQPLPTRRDDLYAQFVTRLLAAGIPESPAGSIETVTAAARLYRVVASAEHATQAVAV